MTLEEYRERAKALLVQSQQKAVQSVFVPAASRLLGTIINRINEGGNSSGGKIGSYSTTPFYASREQFVKKGAFKPQGNGKRKQKKNPKTMYLANGYRQLRDIQGRRTDVVNFNYSGDLLASYRMQVESQYILLGLISEYEARKRSGLEKRFGKTFYGTSQELAEYNLEVSEGSKALTLSILKG